ncbi:MAG: DUF1501 domain-containing protein [Planctomycetaceae bacterium]
MNSSSRGHEHDLHHASQALRSPFAPAATDTIRVGSRRWFLQTGVGGLGGLTLAEMLAGQAAAKSGNGSAAPPKNKKAVILFWLSGGPSQLDLWDPKPDAPREVRGPFGTIPTAIPGVRFGEHLPRQAAIADKLSILRAVDCRSSNHTPITMQAGNPLARRTNDGKDGGGFPSMGSIVSRFRGGNDPDMPGFVGLARSWTSDVYGAGKLGVGHEPVKGLELTGKFNLPKGIELPRLADRDRLRGQFDRLRRGIDQRQALDSLEGFQRQAYQMVLSGKVQQAFDMAKESDATRDAYGRCSVGEKALMARRLVEHGVTYVLVSGAWGYFDHHGDDVRWGGIEKGLKPLCPRIDQALATLVTDLEDRGLLDDTFVMMMGEFGRTPKINEKAGRHHWTKVMSMTVAGGGMPTGQVIGSSDAHGADLKSGVVRPQDLAATTFRHLGIDLGTHWVDQRGRPIPIVTENGRPVPELL